MLSQSLKNQTQKTWLKCVDNDNMANPNRCTYYFEILKDRGDGIDSWKAGVYSSPGYMGAWHGGQSRLSYNSDRIWCQGPQGGVKMVKDRTRLASFGYVTNNAAMMKKFTWVKLRARSLQQS
jgi:hypothetical protein